MEGIPEKECFNDDEIQGRGVTEIVIFEKVVFCVYDENVEKGLICVCVCISNCAA